MPIFRSSSRPNIIPPKNTWTSCERGCATDFPGVTFYELPVDIVTQILNFGLPAPIDIQVVGRNVAGNREFAEHLMNQLKFVSGTVDFRIQQPFNYPKLHLDVDRTKANQVGFTQRDVAQNLLIALSGSFQTAPTFWLDPRTGVSYNVQTETPQYRVTKPSGSGKYSDQ